MSKMTSVKIEYHYVKFKHFKMSKVTTVLPRPLF